MIHVSRGGHGMPLVFIHGWGFDHRIWQSLLPLLQTRYEVFCVDLPGFGLSPFMEWEPFKASLLRQLPTRFALAGWSLGGLVATRLTVEAPERISHLINIASSPCFVEGPGWPGIPPATLTEFYDRLLKTPNEVLLEFTALQLPRYAPSTVPTIDGLKAGLNWLMTWDFRTELKTLTRPVLYLFGRLDRIVPKNTMALMQENYSQFQYTMINGAAHALFLTHTDVFLAEMSCFFEKCPDF